MLISFISTENISFKINQFPEKISYEINLFSFDGFIKMIDDNYICGRTDRAKIEKS